MMASDFSMRAKWRALKSGCCCVLKKCLTGATVIAKVAMARKLAVSLYWMWRKEWNYEQVAKFGSHAGESDYVHGVQ